MIIIYVVTIIWYAWERASRIGLPSQSWQDCIIATIRRPHLVPRSGIEPESNVFQTFAVTDLATSAKLYQISLSFFKLWAM